MTKWMQWTLTAVCALTLAGPLSAAKAPTARNRQVVQQKRIGHGVKSGELTKPEAVRLERNSARIHRSIRKDRVDQGVFTPRERAQAQRKLNRQSAAIARQTHDGQSR